MFPKMILGSFRISLFLATLVLISTFHNFSEAKQTRKLPSAVVVGTVSCDTCFQQDFPKTSHFISGALVAVECGGTTSSNPSFHEEVKTNEKGEFRFHLPFSVSKHLKEIKGCSVKLISSSEPYCAVASTAFSSSIHLKSRKQGTHIFSAGFFTFKPLKQPTLCSQKPSIHNSREFNSRKFPNPIPPPLKTSELSADTSILTTHNDGMPAQKMLFRRMPRIPGFPPNPFRPPPSVLPPNPLRPPPSGLPANPLLPPPSVVPPNPLTPPSLVPPNPFQPPPSVVPPNPLTPPSLVPPNPLRPPPYGLPPNPFQPRPTSPSLFPPNPLQPPPTPPSILPPNPFRPPPSMIPPNPFPPVPGLTPPPSVLPPPAGLPVPVPPFQGPPSPGIPPAGFSEKTSP